MIYADTADRFNQDLNVRRTAAKFMPHLLNDGVQQNRLFVCKDLQDQARKGEKLPF
jgi:hypothetical protein